MSGHRTAHRDVAPDRRPDGGSQMEFSSHKPIASGLDKTPEVNPAARAQQRNRTDPMTEHTSHWDKAMLEKPDFCTVKETAQHLRLCEKQIRRLIERGELPAYRFGAALRIKKQDIAAYVETKRIYK